MMKKSEKSISDWRGIAVAGYAVIILTFGVVGVWAAVAKLDKAVVAPGFVAVETNRKSVQHFEGGMVREIFIKEGDHVTKGEVLFSLKKVQAQANNDLLRTSSTSALH